MFLFYLALDIQVLHQNFLQPFFVQIQILLQTYEIQQKIMSINNEENQQNQNIKKQMQTQMRSNCNGIHYHEQSQQKIKVITPIKNQQIIVKLNQSGSAYIIVQYLPDHLIQKGKQTFTQMWKLHPQQRHKVIMFQKQIQVNRYSQSYMNTPTNLSHLKNSSYMYSGYDTSQNRIELPFQFEPYLIHMKQKNPKYNQVIANWYQNGSDFIAKHADCQRGMIQQAQIAILSFYPQNDVSLCRILDIKPNKTTKTSTYDKFQIRLDQGSIVIMCGNTQNQFTHGIAKHKTPTTPRISLSFRQMMADL